MGGPPRFSVKIVVVTVTRIPIDRARRKELEQEAAELAKDHVLCHAHSII